MPLKCSVKILVDVGYFEVYLNDNFITRARTDRYEEVISGLEFKNLYAHQGRAETKLSNIRVKKWTGKPPVSATKEEMVEYYQKAVKADIKDKWNTFWLGHAHHAVGDFDKAIELYEKAIELGLPKPRAAFYLGDANEQLGNLESAKKFYEIGAAIENLTCTQYMTHSPPVTYTNEENWSAFRLGWINMFEDIGDRDHNFNQFPIAEVPNRLKWPSHVLDAQRFANPRGLQEGRRVH